MIILEGVRNDVDGALLVDADLEAPGQRLNFNPCSECKLSIAACPVGALKPDGYFDFSLCYNHNCQQFMASFPVGSKT